MMPQALETPVVLCGGLTEEEATEQPLATDHADREIYECRGTVGSDQDVAEPDVALRHAGSMHLADELVEPFEELWWWRGAVPQELSERAAR